MGRRTASVAAGSRSKTAKRQRDITNSGGNRRPSDKDMPRCSNTDARGTCMYRGPCLECETNRSRLKAAATVPTRPDGVLFIDWWATVEKAYKESVTYSMAIKKLPGRMSAVDCYKANDSPASYLDRLLKGSALRHNHVTRDIKKEGDGCPGCDNYHQKERERSQRQAHTCTKSMSSMNCLACNRGVPYPHETVEEILEGMAKPGEVSLGGGRFPITPVEPDDPRLKDMGLGPVNNPEAMSDGEILHERRQHRTTLQLGLGSAGARELRARDQDLLRELTRRSQLETEAAKREAHARSSTDPAVALEAIVLLENGLEQSLRLLRQLKAKLF